MCRKNLLTLSWVGVFTGLALYFAGCQTPQVSHAPVAFWERRDLEDVKAHFDARLMPYERAAVEGPPFNRELRVTRIKHHEGHMVEVLGSMRQHLIAMIGKKGGEVVGPHRDINEGGAIVGSFAFDYRRGKTTGVVRCEVKRHPLNREHFDLILTVTEHHFTAAENQVTF